MRLLIVGLGQQERSLLRQELMKVDEVAIVEVPTFRTALATIKSSLFDAFLVDMELDDRDGIVLAPTLKRESPDATSILVVTQPRWATIEAALDLGFSAVIDRSSTPHKTVELLLSPASRSQSKKSDELASLSMREREILQDLSTGLRNDEIARLHNLSLATIKSHLASIYRKLGVRNRVEAVSLTQNYSKRELNF